MLIQVVNQETAIQDFVGSQNLCYAINNLKVIKKLNLKVEMDHCYKT